MWRWAAGFLSPAPASVLHDKVKYEALDHSFLTNLSSQCGVHGFTSHQPCQRSARISASINPRNQTAGGLKYLDGLLWNLSSSPSVVQLITTLWHNLQTEVKETATRPELQTSQEAELQSRLSRRSSACFQEERFIFQHEEVKRIWFDSRLVFPFWPHWRD